MDPPNSLSSQTISAMIGGFLTTLLMTPFDVVKTRQQVKSHHQGETDYKIKHNNLLNQTFQSKANQQHQLKQSIQQHQLNHGNRAIQVVKEIYKNEGLFKLWRGVIPTLMFVLPQTVFYLVTYEYLKQKFKSDYGPAYAGGLSRGLAVSLISPIELFRTKIQSQTQSTLTVWAEMKGNVSNHGIRYLWRGLGPTLARDVIFPFSALYWISIEKIKEIYGSGYSYQQELGLSFVNGSVSGIIAGICTHPFDLVKTLQQVSTPGTRLSTLIIDIYKERGLRGYWAGLGPRLAKISPACGIMISSYEVGKRYFNDLGF